MSAKTRHLLEEIKPLSQADWEAWLADTTPNEQYHQGKSYAADEAYQKSHIRYGFNLMTDPSSWTGRELEHMTNPSHSIARGFTEPQIYEALYIWERQEFEKQVEILVHLYRSKRAPHEYNDSIELPTDILMYLNIKAVGVARYWALHVDDYHVRRTVLRELGQFVQWTCDTLNEIV